MRRSVLLCLSLVSLVLLPCLVHADSLINPGFETGDLTGWNVDPADVANVVTNWPGQTRNYTPPEGRYFLALTSGGGNFIRLRSRA